jgi:ABC-type nitrate/sulfonate/bicarbonate transport system substrate-binding protein
VFTRGNNWWVTWIVGSPEAGKSQPHANRGRKVQMEGADLPGGEQASLRLLRVVSSFVLVIALRPRRAMSALKRSCRIAHDREEKGQRRADRGLREQMLLACNIQLDRVLAGERVRSGVRRFFAWAVVLLSMAASVRASAAPPTRVKVLVPEAGNLQLVAFYVALGAGYFAREGLDVVPVSPSSPALAQGAFTNGEAPAALLPAPIYERLLEERFPFFLAANLLENDPIDLVVPRAIAEAHGLAGRVRLPLADRLRAMRGLRIGVGPHPRPRLVALFASQGLDVDAVATVVVVPGKEQNAALAAGEVDALYTHTPFLENALLDQAAVVVVDQAGGEVRELTGRQIHVLAVTRALEETQPRVVRALVDAIAQGEALVHADPRATVDAVLKALPSRDRAHVEKLLTLYAPAVPHTPRVSLSAIARELDFYPEGGERPNLTGIDLARFVVAEPSRAGPRSFLRLSAVKALLLLVLTLATALAFGPFFSRKRPTDTFL